MPDPILMVPEITGDDIEWVCDLMKLDSLDEPRRAFLASRSTLDVSACPGSGKTTLVVAKLAVLAKKWPHRTRGICVLSHTNVAREGIQHRLGDTVVGQRLLGYPHFIDTIHGFVNRFLALPWLRSNGFPSPTVDNDVTTAFRRGVLGPANYCAVQKYLAQKQSGFDRLRICARDLTFDLGGKPFPAGSNTKSFKLAKLAVETAARAGYFCHDEMFIWARALLKDFPAVASWLRYRFPLIIIDEMQDTFDAQDAILHAVFPRALSDIVVQRVGDPNQAIFDDASGEPDGIEPFPDPDSGRCLGIPNSFRFGPTIAELASPFAVERVGINGLCGIGPKAVAGTSANCRHALFIFPDGSTAGVLDAYGRHVLETFDDSTLADGIVAAVGGVHQDARDVLPGHAHYPKSVPHYWSSYTAEISRREPQPKTFFQYVRAAQAAVGDVGDLSPGVERIAAGLIRLAGRVGDSRQLRCKVRTHRAVADALATQGDVVTVYRRLLREFLIDRVPLTEANWGAVQQGVLAVGCALCDGATSQDRAADFLAWPGHAPTLASCSPASSNDAGPNVYRVVDGERRVDIRLGSIHSVKGQTHLATMLLSTYWHEHSSHRILPWLLGTKANKGDAGLRDQKRLLQTYVAMTRPSHLVCLACPCSTFGDQQPFSAHVTTLEARGWRVAEIVDGATRWHS
jgi:DNA helicase-2/ATP-dependent DNA helicase PcrA